MPKRKKSMKVSRDSKADKKLKPATNDNPIAEVFIKASDSTSSDSSTSESDSSSNDSYYRKKKASKKKKRSHNTKKSLRKLQDQIDLFQRNVDIKLNYLESLIQSLLRNQTSSSNEAINSQVLIAPPVRLPKAKLISKTSSGLIQLTNKELHKIQQRDPNKKIDVPNFPITDIGFVYEWDQELRRDSEYRQSLASVLYTRANRARTTTSLARIKSLMFYIFEINLLSNFSWTGMSFNNRGGNTKKNSFRSCIGILALIRATINYGAEDSEKISDSDLIHGTRDALKRAPEKVKQNFKHVGLTFPFDDPDNSPGSHFKEEQPYEEDGSEMNNDELLEEIR